MSLVDCSINNITLPKLSSYFDNLNYSNSLTQEEIEELSFTNDLSIEDELDYYSIKPVFGDKIHNELGAIWSKLQDWENYFDRKSHLEEYIKRIKKIMLKIKSENVRTSEYFFGFEVDKVIENALQTNFKESGYYYSHQIYDLKFALNLYFYSCLQNDPKFIIKYFDFINQIIINVLRCSSGSRYVSLLNENQVNKITAKIKKNEFKNKIISWFSFKKR